MTLHLRKQRHISSCGLACVSMIANKPYTTVIQDFEDLSPDGLDWLWNDKRECWHIGYNTNVTDIHYMLKHYGVESNKMWSRYRGRDTLPDLSILAVNFSKDGWHWVVAEKSPRVVRILDPWDGEKTLRNVGKVHASIRIH